MICDPCLDRTAGRDEAAAALCCSSSEPRRLHALMDFETELGFYTASFILICFRLPPLKITASLWQTNAPGAKISSSTAAIAHRARAGALRKKSFQRRRRQSGERPRGADSVSHTAIHQPSAPHTAPPAALTRKERRSGGAEGGVDGALWPRTAMSIHRAFYHPLIQRSGSPVATTLRASGGCVAVGGRPGEVLLRHVRRQRTGAVVAVAGVVWVGGQGLMAHALLAP